MQDNPRHISSALQGSELGEFWRYQVGDDPVVALIQDQCITLRLAQLFKSQKTLLKLLTNANCPNVAAIGLNAAARAVVEAHEPRVANKTT